MKQFLNVAGFKSWLGQLIAAILLTVGFDTLSRTVSDWADGNTKVPKAVAADEAANAANAQLLQGLTADAIKQQVTGGSSKTLAQIENDLLNAQLASVVGMTEIDFGNVYPTNYTEAEMAANFGQQYADASALIPLLGGVTELIPITDALSLSHPGKYHFFIGEDFTDVSPGALTPTGEVVVAVPSVSGKPTPEIHFMDRNDLLEVFWDGSKVTASRLIGRADVQSYELTAQDQTDVLDAFTAAYNA